MTRRPPTAKGTVALFATCLVDLMRPQVGFAAASLIEQAGYEVVVPEGQTCCGQPNYNAGDRRNTIAAAERFLDLFSGYEHIVLPSGSCAGMVIKHYPDLFEPGSDCHRQALAVAAKTYELTTFLVEVARMKKLKGGSAISATYHDSCAGLRELGIEEQPRRLLSKIKGMSLQEMDRSDTCCGFGGTFCIKYPAVSDRITERKTEDIEQIGADYVLAGDVGCLLNIEGKLHRDGSKVKARHVAEVLAGMAD